MSSMPVTFVHRVLAILLSLSLLGACGHEPVRRLPGNGKSSTHSQPVPNSPRRSPAERAAIVAVRQVGVPYRYGGSTIAGFDCSGLVQFAYASAGKSIPRTTADQWRLLSPVTGNDLRVGDLLFFRIDGRISHVGLYLGSGRFVHAPSSGREVTIAELSSDFYRKTFVRGGRPN
jgi:cell wall-associated NlpC family hydrolase